MSSSSSSSSIPTPADKDGDDRITAVHPDIMQSHILNRLDCRTLTIASCASVQLLSLCNDDAIWKDICNSTWPSTADPRVAAAISAFSSGYHSFYSDASPALRHYPPRRTHQPRVSGASELISAVDIYYEDNLIHSTVLVTDTLSNSFLGDTFMIEISDLKELAAVPLNLGDGACLERAEEHLRLSWILIDPVRRRAINFSSQKAVESRRHSLTEDIQLRYASVFPVSGGEEKSVMCCMYVHCTWKEDGGLRVIDTYMNMKASDGTNLTAIEGLKTLEEVIEEKRWRSNFKREKDKYVNFGIMSRQRRTINVTRDIKWNIMGYIVTGICILLTSGIHFSEKVACKTILHARRASNFINSWVI